MRSPEILQRHSYLLKYVCLFQMRIHIDRSAVMLLSPRCICLLIVHNFTYLQRLLWEIVGTVSLGLIHIDLCYSISYLWLNLWRVCSSAVLFITRVYFPGPRRPHVYCSGLCALAMWVLRGVSKMVNLYLGTLCSVLCNFALSTWSGVRGGSDIQPK